MKLDINVDIINKRLKSVHFQIYADNNHIILDKHYDDRIHSISTKFNDVYSFINDLFVYYPELEDLTANAYYNYIIAMDRRDFKSAINIMTNLLNVIDSYLDKYAVATHLYDSIKFIPHEKIDNRKGKVVLFTKDDIYNFYLVSILARFYAVLYMVPELELPKRKMSDQLYKIILHRVKETGALTKLDDFIKARLFNNINTHSLSEIWKHLDTNEGIEPHIFAIDIFNFIIRTILPSLKLSTNETGNRNFLGYLTTSIRSYTNYLLKSKSRQVYLLTDSEPYFYSENVDSKTSEKELLINGLTDLLISNVLKEIISSNLHAIKHIRYNLQATAPNVVNISQLLTVKLLSINKIYDLPSDILKLFNLFWYNEILKMDPELGEIRKLLAAYTKPYKRSDIFKDQVMDILPQLVNNISKHYPIQSIHKPMYLKSILVKTIADMMHYTYINVFNNQEVDVNWGKFCSEYIRFISFLSTNQYDSYIDKIKNRFHVSNSNREGAKL